MPVPRSAKRTFEGHNARSRGGRVLNSVHLEERQAVKCFDFHLGLHVGASEFPHLEKRSGGNFRAMWFSVETSMGLPPHTPHPYVSGGAGAVYGVKPIFPTLGRKVGVKWG
jgi:hypothetical protein